MRRLAAAVASVTLALGACTSSASTGPGTSSSQPPASAGPSVAGPTAVASGTVGGPLTIAFNTAISTLDPAQVCDIPSDTLAQNLYDDLVAVGTKGNTDDPSSIQPMLATSWDVSTDSLTYTFHLRSGATFSSGNPVTSADVVYSYNRALKANGCAAYVLTGGLSDNIVSIKASDPMTVVFTLKTADPLFLLDQTLHIGIIDSKTLDQNGGLTTAGDTWLSSHAAGSGPFSLGTYDPNSQVVLQARSDYWGGKPASSQIVARIVTDPSTEELLATSGQIDMAFGVPFQDLQRMSGSPGLTVLSAPSLSYVNVGFNTKSAPLTDVRVRQALTYATPFDQIIQTFGQSHAHRLIGPIMNGMLFYSPIQDPFPYDVSKAKALLQQAGLSNLSLTIDLVQGQSVQQQIATVLQSSWSQIGVTLKINILGSSAWSDAVNAFKDQMYMTEDKADVADPAFLLGYFVRCGDPFNWTQYCNSQVTASLDQARHSSDQQQRTQLYAQIAQQVTQDAPYLQLFQEDQVAVAGTGVNGFVFYSDHTPRFFGVGK